MIVLIKLHRLFGLNFDQINTSTVFDDNNPSSEKARYTLCWRVGGLRGLALMAKVS